MLVFLAGAVDKIFSGGNVRLWHLVKYLFKLLRSRHTAPLSFEASSEWRLNFVAKYLFFYLNLYGGGARVDPLVGGGEGNGHLLVTECEG